MLFLLGFIFSPIKSLREPPQEVAPCFQSHFLISSSESPIIEFILGAGCSSWLTHLSFGDALQKDPSLGWGSWVALGSRRRCISFIRNNLFTETNITRCLFFFPLDVL